jgi:hypothetical protein
MPEYRAFMCCCVAGHSGPAVPVRLLLFSMDSFRQFGIYSLPSVDFDFSFNEVGL